MAYCDYSEVKSEFKDLAVTGSTAITTTDVERFISEIDAYIDARLGLLYVVPIDGDESLKIMKMISIGLVKNRIQSILKVKTGTEEADQESDTSIGKMAVTMLDDIMAGKMILSDATMKSSGTRTGSYSGSNSLESVFEKDTKQW